MAFSPIQKLDVYRTLTTGTNVPVGTLAQNRRGVFFQYDADYLARLGSLSPFTLHATTALQKAPKEPHDGLHGLFADSLPDGWGRLLQDRVFRQHGIIPSQVTPMDRLAFVGKRGMGALNFAPVSDLQPPDTDEVDMAVLGLEAEALFDGQTNDVLSALVAAGSSGGARPKAQLFFTADNPDSCRTYPAYGDDAWLVKFTSQNLALGHEEGLCEAVYLALAKAAGLQPPEWQLLEAPKSSGARAWLAVKRFDWCWPTDTHSAGRLHMHSACGLLDADYRAPSLDYLDLIKASRQLCRSPAAGQLQFRRAIFNLLACNQDDHSKNWAFLQDDSGQWQPAPFYDATFSPHPFNEHATAFMGYGKKPPLKAMQKLADAAGFDDWPRAQRHIQQMADVLTAFTATARDYGVSDNTISEIQTTFEQRRRENSALLT
ncbi:type II toxin-antitoxin system HipA family toxin [Vreelandella subglaciescola]|jgi:serine/threonine-protein kinase HipA|uniref:Serine/threonine-protein kinase HipA n=1 Tax=Vreelandella subglaciescola TaxID=29571 RepID=A0A1M7H541_9GAMM|nr:type II toxin-antitoxin system HipA family toxin [Halomonas subglaciescola]SHM23650.1 serine/threonine-protein kinase HipA [Halomonas subglaciescola]